MTKITAFLVGVLCVCASTTFAGYTYISDTTSDGTFTHTAVLSTLYGSMANLQRIDDLFDELWHNPDGHAVAEAKFAGYTQEFGFKYGGGSFHSLFTITSTSGYLTPGLYEVDIPAPEDPEHNPFVFEDHTDAGEWSSLHLDNSDLLDHMVTYRVRNAADPTYVLCWEDQVGGGDQDYQDLVVEVQFVTPVPAPAAGLLGLLGLAGIGWVKRRLS